MMGLETANHRPTDLRAHPDAPVVAISPFLGDDAESMTSPVEAALVMRTGILSSLVSAEQSECLRDPRSRAFVRTHFAEPQLHAAERSSGAPGQVVGAAMLLLSCGQSAEARSILTPAAIRTTDYWIHHYLALALWREGLRVPAKETLGRLIGERAKDFRPRHALGRMLLSEQRWAESAVMLREASALPNATASVYADLGAALLQIREVRGAIKVLRAALAKDARLPMALNNIGVCYLINKERARAKKQFVQALALEPACRAAVDNLVELHIADEDWDAAETVLSAYLEGHARDELALERLAWIKMSTKNLAQARRLLEQAVTVNAASAPSWNNLAIVHLELNQYPAADRAFQRAISLEPASMDYRLNYARVLAAHDRHAAVIAALPEDGSLSDLDAATLRANALVQHEPRRATTLAFLQAANARFPSSADLEMSLGHLLTSFFGRHEQAISVLKQGLTASPGHLGLANNLAYALIQNGDLPAARVVLESIADHVDKPSPISVFITASWGLLRIREGMFEDGLRYYRTALGRAVGSTRSRLEQKMSVEEARHLLSMGRRDAGVRKARQALSSGADPEFTEEARSLLAPPSLPN